MERRTELEEKWGTIFRKSKMAAETDAGGGQTGKEEGNRRATVKLSGGVAVSLPAMPQQTEVTIGTREGTIGERNGHATREDLIEDENEGEKGVIRVKNPLMWIDVSLGRMRRIEAVIDSGATYSCLNSELYDELAEEGALQGELSVQNVEAGRSKKTSTIRDNME